MSDYLKRLAEALKKREAPMGPDAWDWQQFADTSPAGSVNAPGGVSQPQERDKPQRLGKLLAGASMLPGPSGDLLGPISDAYMYATEPESRTPGNFALSALGALPFLPSLATVYHGSPHKFDAFDLSKIGTGEGAQAYGHGLYFAEAPDVAKQYQKNVTALQMPAGNFADEEVAAAKKLLTVFGPDEGMAQVRRTFGARAEEIAAKANAVQGHLYTVDLPDEAIAKMLDWDKPLSEQTPEVQQAVEAIMAKRAAASEAERIALNAQHPARLTHPVLGKIASRERKPFDYKGQAAVEELVKELGGPEKASEYLRAQGIPGIRYLDGGSRGAGQGTSNYVVFDDKLPKILKRE